jgi:transposase
MIAIRRLKLEDAIMAVRLPDARQLSDEVLEALRWRALRGCEMGLSEAQIADLLGVTRETVSRWWSAYAHNGAAALPHQRTGRPTGSGRTLSAEQGARLQAILDAQSPEAVGIAAPLWTRRAVRDLIRQECGVLMPLRTVGAYLRRWGYTAKRPRRHARDQDPAEVRAWRRQTYPALEARAFQEGAEIHWGDEMGVAADEHPGAGYARLGQAASVEVPDRHVRVNVISTVSNEGTVRFMTYRGTMTAALFLVFVARLVQGAWRKIFLIVDRLKAHETDEVKAWVAEHREQIELFYLPRRAPELNADEYLNNDLKGSVNAEGLPHDQTELQGRIEAFLHKLMAWPEHIKSYFQHPQTQYAAAIDV